MGSASTQVAIIAEVGEAAPAVGAARPARPAVRVAHRWLLGVLLLLAWALHWRTFGLQELGQDGYLSVDLGASTLPQMLAYLARDVHPPLFFAALHGMFALAGEEYLIAKSLPIACSVLALVALYRLGLELGERWLGLGAAALLLVSAPFALLSPTVRPFTMGLFLSVLSLVLTIRLLRVPTGTPRWWLHGGALALVTAAALLTWYLQPFVVALEALIGLAAWRARRAPAGEARTAARGASPASVGPAVLAALGAGALLALPWYAYVLPRLLEKLHQGATVTEGTPVLPSLPTLLAGLPPTIIGLKSGPLAVATLAGWLVALALGIWAAGRDLTPSPFPAGEGGLGGSAAAERGRTSPRRAGRAPTCPRRRRGRRPLTGEGGSDDDRLTVRGHPFGRGARSPRCSATALDPSSPPLLKGGRPSGALRSARSRLSLSGAFAAKIAALSRWGEVLLGLALGVAEIGAILLRWQHPDAAGRYVLGVLPFAILLQLRALMATARPIRWLAAAGLATAVVGQAAWFVPFASIPPHNYEQSGEATFLLQHLRAGDGLLFSDHGRRAEYALNQRFAAHAPAAVVQTSGDRYLGDSLEDANAVVASLLPRVRRIWYLDTEPRPGRAPIGRAALAARAYVAAKDHAGDTDIYLFLTQPPDTVRQVDATFGGAATLATAAYTGQATPGGELTVDLQWKVQRPLGGQYSVFVHLDDASGRLKAQHDGIPDAGLHPTDGWRAGDVIDDRHGILLPADLPPGAYRLDVGLYRADSGQRLTLADGQNQLTLGEVQVAR